MQSRNLFAALIVILFSNRTFNLERNLTACSEQEKNVYPKKVYQTQEETLFDKLDSLGIEYTHEQTLFMNLALFDLESICVQEESFKDTDTTKWIGKHIPISVSISSNLVKEPIFLCNSDPHHLGTSFIGALDNLALQSKAIMKNFFFDIETTIKIKLDNILEKLTQRHNRREQADLDDCDNETCTSTQFLQTQKKQLIDLQEHLERYCIVLPIFCFNSAKYDLNLIKSYLSLILVNIEPTVIKKANQFISFKFGDIQLLEFTNFLGGATSFDLFLKAYKTSETEGFFPYECFDHPDKMQNPELPPYDAFYSKLRSCIPLETQYTDYVNLLKSGLTTEQAVIKLKRSKPPPTGIENYHYLQQIWKQEQMSSFKDFLRWYNNKDVGPTLEAMQKTIAFYHDKNIDMLKLGCTLPNLANICLHKSTDAKFYPFTEGDKDLLEKTQKDIVGGPSIVFTRKAVVDETFIRKSTNICKSIVGIDASQLYLMCQPMPTGLYTRWDIDSESGRFTPRQNKTRSFENMVMSYFQRTRPDCKIESFYTTGRQKKIDRFSVDGFCSHCNTVFEAMGCFYHFCPCQELRPSLTEEGVKRGSRRIELDELRRSYIQEKDFTVVEMWECSWWRHYKTTANVKLHIRENFPYRRSLTEQQLPEGIKKGSVFGYVQCDFEIPEKLRVNFANIPPIFRNTLVSKNDKGDLMKTYAEEGGIMSQPRKMLISSFTLQNGTLITPLLLFYLQLGFVVRKIHRFVKYTPKKCFNSFVHSAVDATRKGDENPISSVVAETMKFLANSFYGYQIMDRSIC